MTTETLRYITEGDTRGIQKVSTAAAGMNQQLGRDSEASAARGRAAMDSMATRAKFLALGIGAIGAVSFKAAADFQKSMNVFQVSTGATNSKMKEASALAIELGNDIKLPGVSAKDAGDAMLELAKGGFTADQSMKAVRGTLLLGQAAQIDYAEASTQVARTLKAFGLPASEAATAVDAIAGASLKSTASMAEITKGMEFSSTAAHELGISVTDTATALAIMNDAGQSGAKAGTALNAMLKSLAAPTSGAAAQMKELGLMTADGNSQFFNARGQFIGMEAASRKMTAALKDLNPQQRTAALNAMGAGTAQKAMNLILGKGEGKWDKYAKAVGKSGTAAKVAAAQTKGYSGVLDALQSSTSTFSIALGTALAPAIVKVLKPLTSVLNFLSKYPDVVAVVLGVVLALATGLWALNAAMKAVQAIQDISAFFKLADGMKKAAVAARALGVAMWTSLGPWGLVLVAIIAIGVALFVLWKKSETFRRIVYAAWDAVKSGALSMWRAIKPILDGLVKAFQVVLEFVKTHWKTIATLLAGPFWPIVALATDAFGIRTKLINAFKFVLNFVKSQWRTIAVLISGPFWPIVALATDAFGIRSKLIAAFKWILAQTRAIFGQIVGAVKGAFAGAASWLYSAGQSVVTGFISGITSKIGDVVSAAKGLGSAAKNAVTGVLGIGSPSKVFRKIGADTVQGFIDGLVANRQKAVDAAKATADKAVAAAVAAVQAKSSNWMDAMSMMFGQRMSNEKTPAELELQHLQAVRAQAERDQALADAKAQAARAETDEERLSAAKAIADAEWAIKEAGLQATAEQERKVMEGEHFRRQQQFDKAMEQLKKYLESGHATTKGALERMKALQKRFGIGWESMGSVFGENFANGIQSMIPGIARAANNMRKVVEDSHAQIRKAEEQLARARRLERESAQVLEKAKDVQVQISNVNVRSEADLRRLVAQLSAGLAAKS